MKNITPIIENIVKALPIARRYAHSGDGFTSNAHSDSNGFIFTQVLNTLLTLLLN